MKCLVCDNMIRLNTLQQLFALQPLLLCSSCSCHLVPKSANVLYEDNEWIRSVIDKLNRGDLVLVQLFKKDLQKALLKKRAVHSNIQIVEARGGLTYPWLEILVESIKLELKGDRLDLPAEPLVITVDREKDIDNQIVIVG